MREASRELRHCFGAVGAACSSAKTLTEASLGIALNFFCVTAMKALILETASHQHPLDCWNRIRASD